MIRFARNQVQEDGINRVIEILEVEELPPLTAEIAAMYYEVDESVQIWDVVT